MAEIKKRDSAIEWLRVASAAGIVWYHANVTGSYWGYAGLIVFLIMSMMFDAGQNIHRQTIIGFVLVAGVLSLPLSLRQKAPEARAIFGAMLGVYLVHPLVLAILRPLTERIEFAGVILAFAI
ncbi:hypothetical protein [Caulobacter sp. DWR3-1-2]|uniref:hypothetical protein n=1 Tax=Caulobacter sp. DWR3-1-2 TaxID=2804647 RepID=UPI003CEEB6E8